MRKWKWEEQPSEIEKLQRLIKRRDRIRKSRDNNHIFESLDPISGEIKYAFWNLHHKQTIHKVLSKAGQRIQTFEAFLLFIVCFTGCFSTLKFFSDTQPLREWLGPFQTGSIQKDWRTFYIYNFYPLLGNLSKFDDNIIEKYIFKDDCLLLVMSPFWNHFKNPRYFGFFPMNRDLDASSYSSSCHFGQKNFRICVKTQKSMIFDVVPLLMEPFWLKAKNFELDLNPLYEKDISNFSAPKIKKRKSSLQFASIDESFEKKKRNKIEQIKSLFRNDIKNELNRIKQIKSLLQDDIKEIENSLQNPFIAVSKAIRIDKINNITENEEDSLRFVSLDEINLLDNSFENNEINDVEDINSQDSIFIIEDLPIERTIPKDIEQEKEDNASLTYQSYINKLQLQHYLLYQYRDAFYIDGLFPIDFIDIYSLNSEDLEEVEEFEELGIDIEEEEEREEFEELELEEGAPKPLNLISKIGRRVQRLRYRLKYKCLSFFRALDEELDVDDLLEDSDEFYEPLEVIDFFKEIIFPSYYLRPRYFSGYRFPDNYTNGFFQIFLDPIFAANELKKREIIYIVLPENVRKIMMKDIIEIHEKKENINLEDLKIHSFFSRSNPISDDINEVLKDNYYQKKFGIYKDKINKKFFGRRKTRTFVFKHSFFTNFTEPLHDQSWLVFTKVILSLLVVKGFQYSYKEYGREIVNALLKFFKLLGLIEDEEWIRDELGFSSTTKGFRIIRSVNKKLDDIIEDKFVKNLLYDITIFFLARYNLNIRSLNFIRNPKRLSKSLSFRSLLLIGPPGTGKTSFVKAISGQIGIPILVQSGNVLKNYYKDRGRGARSIQNLFNRARRTTPCVVFIDELDCIGFKRQFFTENTMGGQDAIILLEDAATQSNYLPSDDLSPYLPKTDLKTLPDPRDIFDHEFEDTLWDILNTEKTKVKTTVLRENQMNQKRKEEQLGMLMQLLIELDGLYPLNDIVVIGATNRPQVLDPALLRSGRFHKIIKLDLPSCPRRVKLLKFYCSSIGVEKYFPWEYTAKQMVGLSAADIAAIISCSALIVNLELEKNFEAEMEHTLESIEQATATIISYSVPDKAVHFENFFYYFSNQSKFRYFKNSLFYNNRLNTKIQNFANFTIINEETIPVERIYCNLIFPQIKKLAYYKIGRALIHFSFQTSSSSPYLTLEERPKNFRYMANNGIVINAMESFHFRDQLEEQLMGFFAGKASEFLSCYTSISNHIRQLPAPNSFNPSNLGEDEMQVGALLSLLIAERWYFYAESICTQNHHPLFESRNFAELIPEDINLFYALLVDAYREMGKNNRAQDENQKWLYRTWWMKKLYDQENFFERKFMKWYRIYLPDPDEIEQSIEWRPPDQYCLTIKSRSLNTKPLMYWNSFLKLSRYYIQYGLMFNTFNSIVLFLQNKKELLDYLIDFFLRSDVVRGYQLINLFLKFLNRENIFLMSQTKNRKNNIQPIFSEFPATKTSIIKNWGLNSRRKTDRYFNFNQRIKSYSRNQYEKSKIFKVYDFANRFLYAFKKGHKQIDKQIILLINHQPQK